MTGNSFILLLSREVRHKFLRFLLSSAGVMVGIWAITLTASLSLGLTDTIVTAINSQPFAREIRLYRLEDGKTSFFELDGAPKFIPLSVSELNDIKSDIPEITAVSPAEFLNVYFRTEKATEDTDCIKDKLPGLEFFEGTREQYFEARNEYESICKPVSMISNVFSNFYANNRNNWYGKTEAPERGEIVVCFRCGGVEFADSYGIQKPEDFVGKKIVMELDQGPDIRPAGEVVNVVNFERFPKTITDSNFEVMEVVAVIDDRNSNNISFTGGASNNFFVDWSYYEQAMLLADPDLNVDNLGYIENVVIVDSYSNLQEVMDKIIAKGYLPFSIALFLVQSIEAVFLVFTVVLILFASIALVASVFGIVNVMTISILERKKQIGILKSIGARDRDIVWLFLIESSLLGVVGWIMGTFLAVIMGFGIGSIFVNILADNPDLQRNLENLNITEFNPDFPWWLFLATFALAVFFTTVSGVLPAIRAGRQNPVDVLRGE